MNLPKKPRRRRVAPKPDDADDRYVVRDEAADILDKGEATVRRWVRDGTLPPERVVGGVHYHSVKALLAFKAKHLATSVDAAAKDISGDLAADAFAAFRDGATAADVVVKLRISPRVARELQSEFAGLAGQFIIDGADVARLRQLAQCRDEDNPLRDGADFVRLIEDGDFPECMCCKKTTPKLCMACVYRRLPDVNEIIAKVIAVHDAQAAAEDKKRREAEALRLARARSPRTQDQPPARGPIGSQETLRSGGGSSGRGGPRPAGD